MIRKLTAALLAAVLAVVGFVGSAPPAGAEAGSIYGIHVYVPTAGFQAELFVSLNGIDSDLWDAAFVTAGARISSASGYVQVYTNGCARGNACSQPRLYRGGSSGQTYVDYKINSNAHLVHYDGTSATINYPRLNGDISTDTALRRLYACDALMRQLGVIEGCRLDGYPSQGGLNILAWMHAHGH